MKTERSKKLKIENDLKRFAVEDGTRGICVRFGLHEWDNLCVLFVRFCFNTYLLCVFRKAWG